MSYNLKNKTIVMLALTFAVMMSMSRNVMAEEPKVPAQQARVVNQPASDKNALITPANESSLDFLNEEPAMPAQKAAPAQNKVAQANNAAARPRPHHHTPRPNNVNRSNPQNSAATAAKKETLPDTEAPKSPFESFGNSILSKVDSDLFNQMSSIEKQNTLLNLEIKREDLKNRVASLRAARLRAEQEEQARLRQEEEKLKDQEAQRKALIIAEQQKLKEKEIELEKVRQAKVLNDYMNEMLLVNQKWIEKSSALQARVRELEKERLEIIANFEKKASGIKEKTSAVQQKASSAVQVHERVVTDLKGQIERLKQTIEDNQNEIKQMREGNAANPFADSSFGINQNDIDMSQEYAIMDITGKGDNIVAKIVSKDGTTFMVHKGSMLKGGEVVTAITDHYIAFENKGQKGYLYTGGTVMDFEPTVTFNGTDRTPGTTEKESIKPNLRNVLGGVTSASATTSSTPAKTTNAAQKAAANKKK